MKKLAGSARFTFSWATKNTEYCAVDPNNELVAIFSPSFSLRFAFALTAVSPSSRNGKPHTRVILHSLSTAHLSHGFRG
jgi:hypothetical protein